MHSLSFRLTQGVKITYVALTPTLLLRPISNRTEAHNESSESDELLWVQAAGHQVR